MRNTPDSTPAPPAAAETREQRAARMAWWTDSKYGMFIHWGAYAIPAKGEWYMSEAKVPQAEYAKYVAAFNPMKFNATEWAAIAKNAGMKYVVLTAKHHEGFAMFDSKVTDYDIMDATPSSAMSSANWPLPAGRPDSSSGCIIHTARTGITPAAAIAASGIPRRRVMRITTLTASPSRRCASCSITTVRSICSGGIPPSDSGRRPTRSAPSALYQEFKQFPKLIINNRLYDSYRPRQFHPEYWDDVAPLERFIRGDYATPEGGIPGPIPAEIAWESCLTINGMWGYKPEGEKIMPPTEVVRNLVDIVSKGGNLLLNVGPDAQGVIPAAHVESLRVAGEWLEAHGEAVYGAGRTLFGEELGYCSAVRPDHYGERKFIQANEWRATTKDGKIYIHIFQWPQGREFYLPMQKSAIKSVYLLKDAARTPLPLTQNRDYVAIKLPATSRDPIATVLCIEPQP